MKCGSLKSLKIQCDHGIWVGAATGNGYTVFPDSACKHPIGRPL